MDLREELPNLSDAAKSAWRWLKDNPVRVPFTPAASVVRTLQSQTRLSEADEERVIAAYRSGKTIYEVGAQFGIHRTTVSAIMQRHGATLHRRPKRPYRRSVEG